MMRSLVYDTRCAVRELLLSMAAAFGLTLLLLISAYAEFGFANDFIGRPVLGDNVLVVLAGKQLPEWRPGVILIPPTGWIALLLLTLVPSLGHPSYDLYDLTGRSMLAMGSRTAWWNAKITWTMATVLIVMFGSLSACFVWTLCCGQDFSLVATGAGFDLVLSGDFPELDALDLNVPILVSLLSVCALACVQLLLSVFLRPTLAFIATLSQLVLAYYFDWPFLVGNGAMLLRSELLAASGGVGSRHAVWSLLMIALSYFLGLRLFRGLDVLKGGGL